MCQAIEALKAESKQAGRQEGILEGSAAKSRKIAIRLCYMGWGATKIANLLEESEATVEQWVRNV